MRPSRKRRVEETTATPEEAEILRMPREIRLVLLAILALALAFRLLHFAAIADTAFPRITTAFTDTDMYANHQWARKILSGDWLGRDTYHPSFEWMRRMAPMTNWERWWGGKAIFQQAPLYPYLLAGLLPLAGGSVTWVLFFQLLLGVLQPLILYGLTARLFGRQAGVLAAALTAGYGPFIFHQGVMLRDWLPPILEPLALLLLLRADETKSIAAWVLAGASLGLALSAKETVLVFLPLIGLWLIWMHGADWRRSALAATSLCVGLLLCLAPLIGRNVVVGAPPFAISNRAAEGIVEGNAADGFPVGLVHPPSTRTILERSDGRLGAVLHETLATYHGDWYRFTQLQLLKLRALVDPFEVPNNVGFSYGRELSPVLRWTVTYGLLFPVGISGIILAPHARRQHALVALYTVAVIGGLMVAPIMARYRLVLVPVLIVYAAALLSRLISMFRDRPNPRSFANTLALVAAVALAQHLLFPLHGETEDRVRAADFLASAHIYSRDGRPDRAVKEVSLLRTRLEERGLVSRAEQASRSEGDYRVQWAGQLLQEGKRDEAQRQLESAEAAYLTHQSLSYPLYNIGMLYRRLGESAKARVYLDRFLEVESAGPRAEQVRRLLAEGMR